jgi:hypothetical protein
VLGHGAARWRHPAPALPRQPAVSLSAQQSADRSVRRLRRRRRRTAPASCWAARRCSGPPSARQRARTDATPCLTSPPPEGAQRSAPAPLRSARAAASYDGGARRTRHGRGLACSVVAACPHTPRQSLRSAVGRTVFYCQAVCRGSWLWKASHGRGGLAGGRSSGAAPLACVCSLRFFLLEGDAMYAALAPASRPGSFRSSVAPVVLRSAAQP